ncbi:MAG TPA: hypothetical protein VKZ63_06780, partial [Kofleriaceae bacterium]|nr:hypothetical protein [Kofleriaceae bacterium]
RDPAFLRQLAGEKRVAGERFAAAAAAPEAAELPGARFFMASATECLAPESAEPGAAQRALGELVAAVGPAFEVRVSAPLQPSLAPALERTCEELSRKLGGAVRCLPGDPEAAVIEVELALGEPEHQERESNVAVRYEVGRNVSPNPGHHTALSRVRMAERSFAEVELAAAQAEQECDAAEAARSAAGYCYDCPEYTEEQRACSAETSMKQIYDRRRSDLEQARSELANTDEVIETPIYETGSYGVRHHTWRAQGAVRVLLGGRAVFDERPILTFEDDEHGGFQPAGVSPDPLAPPEPGRFARAIQELARDEVERLFRVELSRRAAERAPLCGERTEWTPAGLQCRGEYYLLTGQRPSPQTFGTDSCR